VALSGERDGIAEHGDAGDGVEGDGIAVPGAETADQVVAYARLVRLSRTKGWRKAIIAAQGNAVQLVADLGGAVHADADKVALHDVVLGTVVELDAVAIAAHDVAANAVVVAARNLDPKRLIAERDIAGVIDADEIV